MQKFVTFLALISVAAAVVLGAVAVNHLGLIEDLERDQDALLEEVSDLEDELADQGVVVDKLEKRPEVNIRGLATMISGLRTDVDDATSRLVDLENQISTTNLRLNDIEYQLERPTGCFAGDPVYWASGFGGGLTC